MDIDSNIEQTFFTCFSGLANLPHSPASILVTIVKLDLGFSALILSL